jgi:hypothetical protein
MPLGYFIDEFHREVAVINRCTVPMLETYTVQCTYAGNLHCTYAGNLYCVLKGIYTHTKKNVCVRRGIVNARFFHLLLNFYIYLIRSMEKIYPTKNLLMSPNIKFYHLY